MFFPLDILAPLFQWVINSKDYNLQPLFTEGFSQPRKYFFPGHFQDLSKTKLPFSRTKYTSLKQNKSRFV
jgi:hypothetical protein